MSVTLEQKVLAYQAAVETVDKRRAALYNAIRQANAGGESLRSLAAQTGLSFARIHQIVKSG